MTTGTNRKPAITLIETLVVLAIIGVVIALLVVAIGNAREAARRTQCMNNLKQLGIAINAHLDSKKHYPRGENNYSAFVSLLPYIEQSSLYNSMNLSKSRPSFVKSTNVNFTAFSTSLSALVCPSEGTQSVGLGITTYGGNLGTGVGIYGRPDNGPFASSLLDPAIRDALIRDGLANTVALSEFCRSRSFEYRDNIRSVFQLGSYNKNHFDSMVNDCVNVNIKTAQLAVVNRGACWAFDGIQCTLYDHNIVPNGHSCNGGGFLAGASTASSSHAAGVACLHLDGHVRLISSTISLATWRSLGTMNGGEIIGD